MIVEDDYGMINCTHYDCMFCSGGECNGGLYQCPYITERAQACLAGAIDDYEELKNSEPYGEEYYRDLSHLKHIVDTYKSILQSK